MTLSDSVLSHSSAPSYIYKTCPRSRPPFILTPIFNSSSSSLNMATLAFRETDCWSEQSYYNPHHNISPLDDFWSLSLEFNPLSFPSFASPWSASHDKGKVMPTAMSAFHCKPSLSITGTYFLIIDVSGSPPSPSETCSSISTDQSPSPEPVTTRVVCDVPLLAPRPLPYHSPTFLQFDLPDSDEDLSHPPYTNRPSKRKRDDDNHQPQNLPMKRHAGVDRWAARVHRQAWCGSLATQGHSHVYSGVRRHRLR